MPVVLHTTHMVVAVVVSRTSQEEHTEDTVVDTAVVHTVEDNNQRLEAYRKDIDWVSKSEHYTSDSNIVVVVAVAAAVEVIDDSNTSSLEHVDTDHFLE